MQNKIPKIFLFSAAFLMLPNFVWAAPSITSATIDGATLNIAGANFGTKISNDSAPIRFEKFNSVDVGKDIGEVSNNWWNDAVNSSEKTGEVSIEKQRTSDSASLDMSIYPSASNTIFDPAAEGSISRTFVRNKIGFADTHKIFLNFWMYTDFSNNMLNENIDTQLKFIHMATGKTNFGYNTYGLSQRAYSFWEQSEPNSDYIGSSTYIPKGSTGATIGGGWANSLGSNYNIFNAEGWYNMQVEFDQGTVGVANASEKVSIVGPNYAKYGVSSQSGKVAITASPQWYSGIDNVGSVWYNGKKYYHYSDTFACARVIPGDLQSDCLTPDLDTLAWRETTDTDYIDSLNFWLWSQKRDSNNWNQSYKILIQSGTYIYSGNSYEIVSSGTIDFSTIGAVNNNPGTIFINTSTRALGAGDSLRRIELYEAGAKVDLIDDEILTAGQSLTPGFIYQIISNASSFNVTGKGYRDGWTDRVMATSAGVLLPGEIVARVYGYRCTGDINSNISPNIDSAHWTKVSENPWPSSTTKVFLDALYIDNSFARVEIGDNAVYENCTHREIQPTTTWDASGNIILANINKGSFADGAGAYLFVIDEDGTPSAGFPITFATSGDVIAPSAPSGLGVN
ncbi:MAG: hypothetical protein HGA36_03775 [Candidatus Moranbacteria bacterium]|nr:hypothetical protein [Candidatus Moranbacteria bacterium]